MGNTADHAAIRRSLLIGRPFLGGTAGTLIEKPPQLSELQGLSKLAPRVGFEPTTLRLTAGCSAVELPRNDRGRRPRTVRLAGAVQNERRSLAIPSRAGQAGFRPTGMDA